MTQHTCWCRAAAFPVHALCGHRHLPASLLRHGLPVLPALTTLPALPILPLIATMPSISLQQRCWQLYTGRCVTAPLPDALSIQRQQRHKGSHLRASHRDSAKDPNAIAPPLRVALSIHSQHRQKGRHESQASALTAPASDSGPMEYLHCKVVA